MDNDGVPNIRDNCPLVSNPGQEHKKLSYDVIGLSDLLPFFVFCFFSGGGGGGGIIYSVKPWEIRNNETSDVCNIVICVFKKYEI